MMTQPQYFAHSFNTAFQAFPCTLARLQAMQATTDPALLEGMMRTLQLIAPVPIEGTFALPENVLQRLEEDAEAREQLGSLVVLLMSEQSAR